jgi:hypothetical protein
MQLVAIEPPGNVARDIALYRRRLFSALGEGSALAFPDILPLAFASPGTKLSRAGLEGCWQGVDGRLAATGPLLSGGLLYLSVEGPLRSLSSRVEALLDAQSGRQDRAAPAPLEAGIGFFLCRSAEPEVALREALSLEPPGLSFLDCALVVLRLRYGPDPFMAQTWRELARAKRRTGPSRDV